MVHGGNYNQEGFVTEEALSLEDLEGGWQTRTVEDVSRVYSPAVVVSSKFFPDCACD